MSDELWTCPKHDLGVTGATIYCVSCRREWDLPTIVEFYDNNAPEDEAARMNMKKEEAI